MRINYIGFQPLAMVATLFFFAFVTNAGAQIRITEVSAYGSGSGPSYASDWFELTNIGSTPVNITNWRFDDSNPLLANSVPLNGITIIAPGEAVIFLNNSVEAAYSTAWFGASPPSGLQIGNYTGGAGLSTGGDQVNIFDANNVIVASVTFGPSPTVPNLATFDNTAGLNNVTISQLSQIGTNDAFLSVDSTEVGSPGVPAFVPGDANGDGNFDFGDIEAFFLAITDPDAYAALYPNINSNIVLDFDGDSSASFGDIEGFFNALTGG